MIFISQFVSELDPSSDGMIESFAAISARDRDWQQFERMVDSLILDVRPPHRAVDPSLLLEAQMRAFPTSRVLAVEEAFSRWMTEFNPHYGPPIRAFIRYVHNNAIGLFYEVDSDDESGNIRVHRGQRFEIRYHQYQGFGFY